jgi:hypothetical protein
MRAKAKLLIGVSFLCWAVTLLGSCERAIASDQFAELDSSKVVGGAQVDSHGDQRMVEIQNRMIQGYPGLVVAEGVSEIRVLPSTILPLDDGMGQKTPDQLRRLTDIEDMFHWAYPTGPQLSPPSGDPGRLRSEAFFDAIYGDCRNGSVSRNLVPVRWLNGRQVWFHQANGAAEALQRVSDEIARLPAGDRRAAERTAGTYNCRTVAGTGRRSMHAYGVAIDLDTEFGEYWKWDGQVEDMVVWRNRFPYPIVEIFENNGFVWGGRWMHYDTFHFEYRPEIVPTAVRSSLQ